MEISKDQLASELRTAGIAKGDLLHMKVSLKSIGKIEGGAETLIDALLEAVGTSGSIIADSFLPVQEVYFGVFPKGPKLFSNQKSKSYAGVFANEMVRHPKAVRSTHPIQKFVGIGPVAEELIRNHTKDSFAYGVLEEMAQIGAKNVKIGSITKVPGFGTTHVSICRAGLTQRRLRLGTYQNVETSPTFFELNWVGGCSDGFNNYIPDFQAAGALLFTGILGASDIIVSDMKKTLAVEGKRLSEDASSFLCQKEFCLDCRVSWKHSNQTYTNFIFQALRRGKLSLAKSCLKLLLFGKDIRVS